MDSTRDRHDIHFFVIYRRNKDDADGRLSLAFVKHLVSLLEDRQNGQVGYYADRDAPPGSDTMTEFFEATRIARFVIVVMSGEFVREQWTGFLQKAAFCKLMKSDKDQNTYLPIALGINQEVVEASCPHLGTKEVLYVPEDFLQDRDWENHLNNVHGLKSAVGKGDHSAKTASELPLSVPVSAQQNQGNETVMQMLTSLHQKIDHVHKAIDTRLTTLETTASTTADIVSKHMQGTEEVQRLEHIIADQGDQIAKLQIENARLKENLSFTTTAINSGGVEEQGAHYQVPSDEFEPNEFDSTL